MTKKDDPSRVTASETRHFSTRATMPSLPWSTPDTRKFITQEEQNRVYELVRSGRDVHQWSDEEKVLFVEVTQRATRLPSDYQIAEALRPLDESEVVRLLRQLVDEGKHVQVWYLTEKSLEAMSSGDMTREELITMRDDVFGGREEWMQSIFRGGGRRDYYRFLISGELLLPITFEKGIVPLKHFEKMLLRWHDNATNRNLFDIVCAPSRHHLVNSGALGVEIVEDAVFNPCRDTSTLLFLKEIYSEQSGLIPRTDVWIRLMFTETSRLCNMVDSFDYDDDDADDDGVDIEEIMFCKRCEEYERDNRRANCACSCESNRLHLDECRFLMGKNVPIPKEFWERCAYHNQWRLAHYLHVHRPESFELNIPMSALRKAVEFDRVGFVKFLIQYGYFKGSDVSPDADISTAMREYLGTRTKKRRRDALTSAQEALDEHKQDMPENTYVQLCQRFHKAFHQ